MKSLNLLITILIAVSLACTLSGLSGGSEGDIPDQPPPQSNKRWGDGVCDGPENAENCAQDCSAVIVEEDTQMEDQEVEQDTPPDQNLLTQATVGIVYAEIDLERTAGEGDCGNAPWYSADCTSLKIWWGLDLRAVAQSAVLIIPDGNNRWVVTNHPDVVSKYNIDLNNFLPANGDFQSAAIDFSPVPECSGEIEVTDFNFQVMGTYEGGGLELILSANPEEFVEGSCAGTGFSYNTSDLQYGWAVTLSGDPLDLSFDMNDTFKDQYGKYTFEVEIDTNPSPENRDHVRSLLEFMCIATQPASVMEPIPCPWDN